MTTAERPGTARKHADDEADSAKRRPAMSAEAGRIGHSQPGMRTNLSVADLGTSSTSRSWPRLLHTGAVAKCRSHRSGSNCAMAASTS